MADEDMPYLVMRYVEGEDLSSLLRREGRLDPRRAAAIVDQIAGALDEAHARGLVHRDVKPANVIVESRRGTEHAYLTDFGLTREIDASGGSTATGRWVGTIDYASPEQIKGRPGRCPLRRLRAWLPPVHDADRPLPFEREEDVAKLYAHVSEPPPAPSELADGVTDELDVVVERAMAKEPDDRFLSAGDLGRAALSAATGAPVSQPEHSVATGEAAPVTQPAEPTPTKPSEPPPTEPASTVAGEPLRPLRLQLSRPRTPPPRAPGATKAVPRGGREAAPHRPGRCAGRRRGRRDRRCRPRRRGRGRLLVELRDGWRRRPGPEALRQERRELQECCASASRWFRSPSQRVHGGRAQGLEAGGGR